jgi:glycosyltransferase involved in cell wall biosynthesis
VEKTPKLSIVTAYFNRKNLFLHTLDSINESPFAAEIEMVVADDASDDTERLEDIASDYKFPIHILRIEKKDKWYSNPCVPFNKAIKRATADIVLIQNPECYHVGDVLGTALTKTSEENYVVFSCYSLNEEQTNKLHRKESFQVTNKKSTQGGVEGWYNHPDINPRPYHFASSLSRKVLNELGGFDERYAEGVGFDDDEFLHRIKLRYLSLISIKNPFVLHQNHYNVTDANRFIADSTYREKVFRNKRLFEEQFKNSTDWRANNEGSGI